MWIGLYNWAGAKRGGVGFFDALGRVPQFGRPTDADLLGVDGLVEAIVRRHDERNKVTPAWQGSDPTGTPPSLTALDEQGLLSSDEAADDD